MVAAMHGLLLLLFGALCGAVGTALFFTIDPSFETAGGDGAGGGNARISLDEEALATLVEQQLTGIVGLPAGTAVTVVVEEAGLLQVNLVLPAAAGFGIRAGIVLDPEVVNGRLQFNIVEASLGRLAGPEAIAEGIAHPLRQRLEALSGGLDYRLTSIRTTDRRLTLEIAI